MVRLSYSQISNFLKCRRWWYLNKIECPVVEQDTRFLNRGSVVHSCMEYYYSKKPSMEQLKECFLAQWNKYNLDTTFPEGKEESWEMVKYGAELDISVSKTEFKISLDNPNIIGYLDLVNLDMHWVADFKTSSSPNEEYKHQLKYYAYFYYRTIGTIPTTSVFYLKLRTKEDFVFSKEELIEVQKEMIDVGKFIDEHKDKEDYVQCCNDGSQCHNFCPYKELCFPTPEINWTIGIKGNNIHLLPSQVSDEIEKVLKKVFSFQVTGAEFATKNSNWDGYVRLYNPRYKCVPIGFLDKLLKVLEDYCKYKKFDFNYTIQDMRKQPTLNSVKMPEKLLGIELRDYQIESVAKFMNKKVGVLSLCTSAGKTEVASEIIRKLGVKTLWLTHKKELLIQTRDRIKARLGIEVGTIQGETCDIKDVTVAMVQTLNSRYEQYKDYLKSVEFVVGDEIHHALNSQFQNILKITPATYRLGLTGSFPSVNEKMLITSQLGEIVHEITSKDLIEAGHLADPEVTMYRVENSKNYYNWIDAEKNLIVCNEKRNLMIKDICTNYPGFSVIIVTKIEHGEILNGLIPDSIFLNGQLNDKLREEIMVKARNGEIKVLISTVINEGVDIPRIENLIFASGRGASPIFVIQSAGRVLRKHNNIIKRIFDFVDYGKYVSNHSRYRKVVYETFAKVTVV